ncbi:MAG TPA: hypothetical protein VHB46_03970 [Burkholderiales bacterium]|nr:hypothetical protein [Burkholderiales bacterium]
MAAMLAFMHAAACVCAIAFLPGWLGLPLAAGVMASLAFSLRRHALLVSPDAVIEITVKEGNRCELVLRDGRIVAGRLAPSTFVSPLLIVLNVSIDGMRSGRSVVLMPGSAAAEEVRALRVWLRHRAGMAAPASEPF